LIIKGISINDFRKVDGISLVLYFITLTEIFADSTDFVSSFIAISKYKMLRTLISGEYKIFTINQKFDLRKVTNVVTNHI